jgi:hypothetical protein
VFLQVVSHPGDIGVDLHPVDEAYTRKFAQSRVGLLGCFGRNLRADTAFVRSGQIKRDVLLDVHALLKRG